jgi:hypothetical protein
MIDKIFFVYMQNRTKVIAFVTTYAIRGSIKVLQAFCPSLLESMSCAFGDSSCFSCGNESYALCFTVLIYQVVKLLIQRRTANTRHRKARHNWMIPGFLIKSGRRHINAPCAAPLFSRINPDADSLPSGR